MKSAMRQGLLIAVAAGLAGSCATGVVLATTSAGDTWDVSSLRDADIVVRGTVASITEGTVRQADFWMLPESEMLRDKTVAYVTMHVNEVLRGPAQSGDWTLMVYNHPLEVDGFFPVGQEMVVCGFFHPRLRLYYQTAAKSRYLKTGSDWASRDGDHTSTISDSAMRASVRQWELANVIEQAELIVEGEVVAVEKSVITGPDGAKAELAKISLRVDQLDKGRVVGIPRIDLVAITRGRYSPEWRMPVPKNYVVGQRWLCMLKRNEHGWYSFAGVNGLFQVVDGGLIYAERVTYWRTRSYVREAIRLQPGR
ncbi:MAG: hypothetical protein OEX18_12645 [Candidatus Krumholzibacteria bacterium]|nr:hypothetical protein [Candidatus Krumholzibacteria bacterium]MDH5271263.1 hypothetical protein [Candidatus Krumholzibacteria bacterium]